MQQVSSNAAGYEFDPIQSATIRSLAGAMRFVAIIELILGLLYMVVAVFAFIKTSISNVIIYLATSIVTMVLAAMLSNAAASFRSIVDTRGADVPHLMRALDQLGGYFRLKRLLYILALALIAVGIVLVVLFSARVR